ncbi:MAG: hypothetical protein KDI48_09175 [Xanthomonadales bacterium]|nr:hypothetical protein [Xanthomonadales bacterium]
MRHFPLLLLPVLLLHGLALGLPEGTNTVLASFALPSGGTLALRWYEALLVVGVAMLYGEVLKSTFAGASSVLDHGLSLLLFVVLLLELLLAPFGADPGFLLLTLLCLFDVISGFTVAIAVARRDVGIIR